MINDYLSLSTRAGFNKSLAHFRMVTDIVRRMNQGDNLAEVIDDLEKGKGIEKAQIAPILNAVVVDRMGYSTRSFNLPADLQDFGGFCGELQKWNRLDALIAYHHPQLGISLINPKNTAHWETIRELAGDELLVLYVKAKQEDDAPLEMAALDAMQALLLKRKVGDTAQFGGAVQAPVRAATPPPPAAAPKPAAAPAPPPRAAAPPPPPKPVAPPPEQADDGDGPPPPVPSGKVKMTPKYAVQVSNELFHNGNVEAWKNIVESYKTRFAGLDVHVYHDGQKVNNLNSLFKWGKVKHGDVIVFCVAGEEIKGVAKLQRYLYEGASLRFEKFLKKDVNKVLNLF